MLSRPPKRRTGAKRRQAAKPTKPVKSVRGVVHISKSFLSRFTRLSLPMKLTAGFIAIFGAYAGWVSILPRVNIAVPDTRFRERFPTFVISNSGYTSARNVSWDYSGRVSIYVGSAGRPPDGYQWDAPTSDSSYAPIGTLESGGEAVRRCREVRLPPGANLSPGTRMMAIVKYTSALWPVEQTQMAIFRLRGREDMDWYWEYDGRPLSFAEAKALEREGFDLNTLTYIPE